MTKWKLVETDVKFSRMKPKPKEFVADLYECTKCHGNVNNSSELPKFCPWCGEWMGEELKYDS